METTLIETVRELLRLLEIVEESESGRLFRPNQISSCRVMDGLKLEACLKRLRKLSEEHPNL